VQRGRDRDRDAILGQLRAVDEADVLDLGSAPDRYLVDPAPTFEVGQPATPLGE